MDDVFSGWTRGTYESYECDDSIYNPDLHIGSVVMTKNYVRGFAKTFVFPSTYCTAKVTFALFKFGWSSANIKVTFGDEIISKQFEYGDHKCSYPTRGEEIEMNVVVISRLLLLFFFSFKSSDLGPISFVFENIKKSEFYLLD